MNREERLKTIFAQFERSAKAFCEETGGLSCNVSFSREDKKKSKSEDNRCAKIYYKSYMIVFKYTPHSVLGAAHSILDCWVFFGKSDSDLPVPLPFVVDFCNEDIVAPLSIPYISNERGMEQAFSCVGDVLKKLMQRIADISYDEEQKQAMQAYFFEEFSTIIGDSANEAALSDYYFNWLTLRFSSIAYLLAIKGKTEKAIKELNKTKDKFRYEKRLLHLWQEGKVSDCSQIPDIVVNLQSINDKGIPKTDTSGFFPIFLSWFVLAIPAAVVYLGIYFLMILLQKHGSVYLTGVLQNFPYTICAGFLTAIPISYFTRFWFSRKIFKKNYEELAEMDHIINGVNSDKVIKVFLYIIVGACVALSVLISKWNINFKKDGFVDNTKLFSVTGIYYSYQEIDHIQYIADRVNGFGETIDFPSYAIVMKNGKTIDLYEYDDVEYYYPELIEFLQSKNITVVKP
ncbi:MAG: hypothetical protein KBS52_03715 [Clostridiales bacterium]|nr:hypothetical protein [Candidatus Equinaster intestinalis]